MDGKPVKDVNDVEVADTTTNGDGSTSSDNLPAGDYKVEFILPDDTVSQYRSPPGGRRARSGELKDDSDAVVDKDDAARGVTRVIHLGDDSPLTPSAEYPAVYENDGHLKATQGIDLDGTRVSSAAPTPSATTCGSTRTATAELTPMTMAPLSRSSKAVIVELYRQTLRRVTSHRHDRPRPDEDGCYLLQPLRGRLTRSSSSSRPTRRRNTSSPPRPTSRLIRPSRRRIWTPCRRQITPPERPARSTSLARTSTMVDPDYADQKFTATEGVDQVLQWCYSR